MAKVCFVPAQGTLAAYLTGEIDHAAQALRREIDAQIDARMPELLTMDFSGVTFMDTPVGLILAAGARCPAWVAVTSCAKRTGYRAPHAGPGAYPLRLIVGRSHHENAESGQNDLPAAASTKVFPVRHLRRFWPRRTRPCRSWRISKRPCQKLSTASSMPIRYRRPHYDDGCFV